jgi:small subunit ribosomal protein S7e
MFTARKKIVKEKDAPIDAFEEQVAQVKMTYCCHVWWSQSWSDSALQAIFDLQVQSDLKADLQDLFITSAKEVEVSSNRKAIIIHVPFRLLKNFHRFLFFKLFQLAGLESHHFSY